MEQRSLEVKRSGEAAKASPDLSEREIASRCGVSWDMASTIKRQLGMKPRGTMFPVKDFKPGDFIQARAAQDDDYADELAAKLRDDLDLELPPIVVFELPDTGMVVPDGFHRHKAYYLAGRERIPARIIKGTRQEALAYALGANEDHGLKRNAADKRNAVKMALADPEMGKKPVREIARLCKVSYDLVVQVKGELDGSREVRDGSSRQKPTLNGARSSASNGQADAKKRETPCNQACGPAGPGPVGPGPVQPAAPPAERVCDHFGRPVPDGLADVFGDTATFRSLIHRLGLFKSEVEALKDKPGGRHVKVQEICIDLDNAQRSLRCASPYAVCPECGGRGHNCKVCHGTGWIREGGYPHLTQAQKDVCEAYARDARTEAV